MGMPKEEHGLMETFCDKIWRDAAQLESQMADDLPRWELAYEALQVRCSGGRDEAGAASVPLSAIAAVLDHLLESCVHTCRVRRKLF